MAERTHQPPDVDAAIARLAHTQHGNITGTQLHALGLTRNAIFYRVRRGHLHRTHRGVFAVGRPARTGLERASAAVLACGPTARLSHHAALTLWGFTTTWPHAFDVTVTTGDPRPQGITVHRSTTLARHDQRVQLDIPTTSPARTLLDCAPTMTTRDRARLINDALHTPFLTQPHLADIRHRCPTHPGARLLDPFLDPTHNPTRSQLEDDFIAFCHRFGLPEPVINTIVAGHEADAVFPDHNVIIELDGWEFHHDQDAFESDRDRDADTLTAGYVTVRITKRRLTQAPAREAGRLHEILADRTP